MTYSTKPPAFRCRWVGVLACLATLGFPRPAAGRQTGPVRFSPADWGLSDPGAIRYGEFGLLLEPGGARLVVYDLDAEWSAPTPAATSPHGVTPPGTGGGFVVSRLQTGNRNALGGYFNVFSRAPASGTAWLTAAPDGRRALLIDCTVEGDGFCGAWMHLFDFRLAPGDREFLDSRPFTALTFRVWTERPDDQLLLKVADARWEAREDAPPVGMLHEFVAAGHLGPRWRRVTVPLRHLHPSLDRATLASIILQSVSPGRTRAWIRDLMFVVDTTAVPDLSEPDSVPSARPASIGPHRAVWVWNTAELLADSAEAVRTTTFLAGQGVDFVFLQVPDAPSLRRSPGERVLEVGPLRRLIAGFSRAGIRTYALDGAAWFANPSYHDGVVRTVAHVAAYNAAVQPDERFYGVRYDIEPYLLPGFHGPGRDRILRNFLTLVERIVDAAHRGGLVAGFDIPFWYDAPNERTFSTVDVEWHGVVRPASHHVIDLADDVSIMAYRTAGYGADGTITHAEGEIRFAATRGKQVFVGLETTPLPDEVMLHIWGPPRHGLPEAADQFDRIVVVPGPDSVEVMLYAAGTAPSDFLRALGDADPTSVVWWPVRRKIDVPASKLSFAGMDAQRLRDVQVATAFELSRFSSFAGFAVHDVIGWRALLEPAH